MAETPMSLVSPGWPGQVGARGPQMYEASRMWGSGVLNDALANGVFTGVSSTNVVGNSLVCVELESDFEWVQPIFCNQSTTETVTHLGWSAVAVADFADKKQDALFASEAVLGDQGGITIPVRSGRSNATIMFGEKKTLKSKARTDGGTAPAGSKRSDGTLPRLVYFRIATRVHDGVATVQRATFAARAGADLPTTRAQVWCARAGAAPTANFTGAFGTTPITANNVVLLGVRYGTRTKTATWMTGGSSLTAGASDELKKEFGIARAFNDASTALTPMEVCDIGMSSHASTNAAIGAAYAAGVIKPTFGCWEFCNPNDIGGSPNSLSQAQFDTIEATMEANRLVFFNAVAANGGRGSIVWDGIPRNSGANSLYDATHDGYRQAILARLPGRGFDVAGVNAVMQDGTGTPQRMRVAANGFAADETGDGLHPLSAGYVALEPAFATAIANAKLAFFGA